MNEHLSDLLRGSKMLTEAFLGGRPLDSLVYRLVGVWELSVKNWRVEEFFHSASHYLFDAIDNPNLLCQSKYKGKRGLFREKERSIVHGIY